MRRGEILRDEMKLGRKQAGRVESLQQVDALIAGSEPPPSQGVAARIHASEAVRAAVVKNATEATRKAKMLGTAAAEVVKALRKCDAWRIEHVVQPGSEWEQQQTE